MSDIWSKRVDGQPYDIAITEAEPGLVHVTTDALHELLRLGGFAPTTPEKENHHA